MQVIFYGYGTGWHWCYYYSMAVQIICSILILHGLRYCPAIWKNLTFVKAFTVLVILGGYIELLLPIPGFFTVRMLHLVPFQSPTWSLAYFYIIVRHSPYNVSVCGSDDLVYVTTLVTLCVCAINAVPSAVQVPIMLLVGHVCSLFSACLPNALSSTCNVHDARFYKSINQSSITFHVSSLHFFGWGTLQLSFFLPFASCHCPLSMLAVQGPSEHMHFTCRFLVHHFNPTTDATPSGQFLSSTLAMLVASSTQWQVILGSPS
jgi:hypothetical protein